MAELFQTTASNVGMHLANIYVEGELDEVSTTKDFLVVRQEGKKQVNRKLKHYNLDAIISVGYRIRTLGGLQKVTFLVLYNQPEQKLSFALVSKLFTSKVSHPKTN